MDIDLPQNPIGDNPERKKKRRRKRRVKRKSNKKDGSQGVDHTGPLLEVPINEKDLSIPKNSVLGTPAELDSTTDLLSEECTNMDTRSTGNSTEGSVLVNTKKRKKKTKKKKRKSKDKGQSLNQLDDTSDKVECMNQIDNTSDLPLVDDNPEGGAQCNSGKNGIEAQKSDCVVKELEPQKAKNIQAPHCDYEHNVNYPSPSLLKSVHGVKSPAELREFDKAILKPEAGEIVNQKISTQVIKERFERVKIPTEVVERLSFSESPGTPCSMQMAVDHVKIDSVKRIERSHANVEAMSAENCSRTTCLSSDHDITRHTSSTFVNQADHLLEISYQYPKIGPVARRRRKLLVLDVNGLLADIVMPAPKDCVADIHILGRAIFRRPFYLDFLGFCFENFDVGIWSSRSKRIIDKVVDYLLGDLKHKLLFCWDIMHTTPTGFNTLENRHKPMVCKELRKIWENDGPNLRWKKGDYNESNTLLLDDSPYKALLNPVYSAIFPCSFKYTHKDDNSLGPGGDIRVYLEALLTADDVQKFVQQHPFGQNAIDERSPFWDFYSGVLHTMFARSAANPSYNVHQYNYQLPLAGS